jgi:hypothetical protein
MNQRHAVLIVLLIASICILIYSYSARIESESPAPVPEEKTASEFDAPGVTPGSIVWANWREGKGLPEPAGPGPVKDVRERPVEEGELPEEVRKMLEERYQGIAVALPRRDR